MIRFYISKVMDLNNDFEIHTADCLYLPIKQYRNYLGEFSQVKEALKAAKLVQENCNFCYWCFKEYHESKHPFQLPEAV